MDSLKRVSDFFCFSAMICDVGVIIVASETNMYTKNCFNASGFIRTMEWEKRNEEPKVL